jgi:hypothetical protein
MALPTEWTPDCYVRNVTTPEGVVKGVVTVCFYDDIDPIIGATVRDHRGMVDGETFSNSPGRWHSVERPLESVAVALAACDQKLGEVVLTAPPVWVPEAEQLEACRPAESAL